MKSGIACVGNAVIYAVVLNLVLPMFAVQFATEEEKNPPGCPSKLSLKSQIMHMMYHHSKTPVSSSLIVAVIVASAIMLGYNFGIFQ